MTFRLPFQISRVGALCRPTNPDGLVSKLVVQKGNLNKLISFHTKKIRSASLLQECKNAVSYIPTNHSSTLTGCEYAKTPTPKLQVIKECEANDYYPKCEVNNFYTKLEDTNVEPYANRMPSENRPKISFSNRCIQQLNTVLPKYDNYEMEINDIKIKDIEDQKSTTTKSEISSSEVEETKSIMSDLELKIQNDIWLQSSSEIVNSLNSKNSIWKLINCNRQTMNNDFTNFTSQMQTSSATTKPEAKDTRTVHLGTRHFPCIYMSTKKMTKRNYLDTASKLQARFREDLKKLDRGKERRAVLEENTATKPVELKENTQISESDKSNEISDNLEPKQSVTDSKFKIINSPVNVSPSKIYNMSVYNRRPNNPTRNFTETYRNSYRFYHLNSTKDLESCNTLKYSKINYNAENNTNLLHNEIVEKGIMLSDSNIPVKANAPIESATPNKISEPISGTAIPKEEPTSGTTKEVAKQCSESSANLKQKKGDPKIGNKIKSTRIPRTLGEIYGVGKIPFLVEVSKPGQATHKQYLVVMQLPEIRKQDSSLNCTNSPLSLIINIDTDSDFSQEETLLSPRASLSNYFKANQIPSQTLINNKHVPEVDSIGLVKNKNKILPLLEINEKHYEPFVPTKLSQQLIEPTLNKKDKDTDWAQETSTSSSQCGLNDADDHSKIATSRHGKDHYKKLQRILNNTDYMKSQKKLNAPALSNCNQVRLYSTMNRRNKTQILFPGVHHKRNYSCCYGCPYCGQYPCVCRCQCSPCGWYPHYPCRPQCCPKFQLDFCCPRGRWDCSIPVPPCVKIEAPYPSYGENMPTWCKEPTECFDFEEHMLQPKNQVSPKINLMEEAIPKVTVVDPALERKCCMDKWCEPCYPCVDQRICFCDPYQIPVDCCCPRGRPHCYCWPEKQGTRKPPPYRCFSDEDLEFPEVEITEHDLAKRFASDLYRRMGKKCLKPFTPACMVNCDLRSGEPQPVCKYDPKGACTTTCVPPGAYLAPCTYQRVPPCEIPGCNTWNNCRMPTEGNKKTICTKKNCPEDCCGYCPKEPEVTDD